MTIDYQMYRQLTAENLLMELHNINHGGILF